MGRFVVLATLLLAGCHGSGPTTPQYPPFYQAYNEIPAPLRKQLDSERSQVLTARPADPASVQRYARTTARLARHQAAQWLPHRPGSEANDPATIRLESRRQSRVSESCRQALGLYNEAQFLGCTLDWQDEVERIWLLVLIGHDQEASAVLADLRANPDCPTSAAGPLEDLQHRLAKITEAP